MKAFRRARTIGLTLVVMAVVAGASFFGTNAVVGAYRPNARLIAGTDFTIDSTVTAYPSCPASPTALLYPGTQRCLTYTVHNPLLHATLSVLSLSAAIDTTVPEPNSTACPLDLSQANLSGTQATPIITVPASGTNTASAKIKLTDTGTNQSPTCEGVTYHLKLSGSATYSEVYSTGTVLTSSQNPSNVGQSVTYTATVTASATGSQDAVPSSPTGTVTFYDGAVAVGNEIPGCSARPMTSTGTTTATATCASPVYGAPGSHTIYAVYTPDTPGGSANFSTSQGSMTQQVNSTSCVTIATTGPSVTVITGTYSGNYTVNNGATLYLNGGTITGNVTVQATGKFIANGGTVKGNVQSQGGPVSLTGTTVGGSVQMSNAALALGANTKVTGSVSVTGGNTMCITGGTAGPVKIGTGLTIQSLTATTTPITVCNTQVTGNFTYQNSAAPAIIGGSSACPGNTVTGNFTVQAITANLTIGGSGFGNAVTGAISVHNNKGGGTLTNNSSTTSCALNSDTPGIVGTLNTAPAGKNTCNATA